MKRAATSPRLVGESAARHGAPASRAAARLPDALREIAAALGAASCGVAALRDDETVVVGRLDGREPAWRDHPPLLAGLRGATGVVEHHDSRHEAHWLFVPMSVAQVPEPWMLWAERDDPWNEDDAAGALTAAAALERRLPACCAVEVDAAQRTALMDQAAWMSGRLAHDFGNVLTGVLGFTELTLAQLAPETAPHRYLTEVWQSARAGANWVHQLQMFGRRTATNLTPTSLGQVLASEAAEATARGARLQVAAARALPPVAIEPEPVRQLLAHVLDNAREACAEGGTITLNAQPVQLDEPAGMRWLGQPRLGAAVEIAVADTGTGMTEAAKARLFRQLFFSTKPQHRGLGLAVAYGVVRAYGGGLRFEDNTPRGTVVRVVLPCSPSSRTSAPVTPPAARMAPATVSRPADAVPSTPAP